jgi:hypothetical protein
VKGTEVVGEKQEVLSGPVLQEIPQMKIPAIQPDVWVLHEFPVKRVHSAAGKGVSGQEQEGAGRRALML